MKLYILGKFRKEKEWTQLSSYQSSLQHMSGFRKKLNLKCSKNTYKLDKNNSNYQIKIKLSKSISSKVIFWASKPNLLQIVSSFSAYKNTKNKGETYCKNGIINFSINYPSSYLEKKEYKYPHVHMKICATGKIYTIRLEEKKSSKMMCIMGFILLSLLLLFYYTKRKN